MCGMYVFSSKSFRATLLGWARIYNLLKTLITLRNNFQVREHRKKNLELVRSWKILERCKFWWLNFNNSKVFLFMWPIYFQAVRKKEIFEN